jgi:thiosulfate dehydrogenase [quinone] large subunit
VAGVLTLGGATGTVQQWLSPSTAAAASRPRGTAAGPGLWLGNVTAMARNQALAYTDPASGDPALLLHLADGRYVAYDVVCTHAGCTVPYDPARRLLICPCHGATYDPARGAAVITGPAPSPLQALAIRVDTQGNVYALDGKPATGKPTPRLQKAPPSTGQGSDDEGAGSRRGGRRGGSTGDDGGSRPPGTGDD